MTLNAMRLMTKFESNNACAEAEALHLVLALHFQQQHRHLHFVAHFVDSRPVKYVADEAVAVCGHRNEIDIFLASEFDDLVRGFA